MFRCGSVAILAGFDAGETCFVGENGGTLGCRCVCEGVWVWAGRPGGVGGSRAVGVGAWAGGRSQYQPHRGAQSYHTKPLRATDNS